MPEGLVVRAASTTQVSVEWTEVTGVCILFILHVFQFEKLVFECESGSFMISQSNHMACSVCNLLSSN